ncbi:hypothetical protein D3C85_1607760 [compost metagenome]
MRSADLSPRMQSPTIFPWHISESTAYLVRLAGRGSTSFEFIVLAMIIADVEATIKQLKRISVGFRDALDLKGASIYRYDRYAHPNVSKKNTIAEVAPSL